MGSKASCILHQILINTYSDTSYIHYFFKDNKTGLSSSRFNNFKLTKLSANITTFQEAFFYSPKFYSVGIAPNVIEERTSVHRLVKLLSRSFTTERGRNNVSN